MDSRSASSSSPETSSSYRDWRDPGGGGAPDSCASSQHDSEPADNKHPTPKSPSQKPRQNIIIPKIEPISSTETPTAIAQGLEGKFVDEFGNILGWDGTVLGRAEGDLPSMMERPVSKDGKIRDSNGQVVGYVSENLARPTTTERGYGLRVDETGDIYDQDGEVVGKMRKPVDSDAASGPHFGREKETKESDSKQSQKDPHSTPQTQATPNLSELCLDIKSTHDGIQLIIKIPTVFNRDHIHR